MTPRERAHCKHERLNFGSGDYYICCQNCGRSWVQKGAVGDEADASNLTKAPMNSYDAWVPEAAIAAAVEAEQERCAKVAKRFGVYGAASVPASSASERIAAAIRARSETEEK